MQNQRATETKPTNGTKPTYVSSRTLPFDTATNPIVRLQQTIGNRGVQLLLRSPMIQAKLAISQPGDIFEQEADRVADHVMRMPDPAIQRTYSACAAGGSTCPKCELERKPLVQRKTEQSSDSLAWVTDNFLGDLGPGEPLDTTTRAYFEPRFSHDFSSVRVHTDAKAAQSARKMNALAYAQGRDLVFEAAQYEPGTMAGQRLLAHELTHVVQQRAAPALAFDAASRIMKISNRGLVPNLQCDDKGKDPIEVYVDTLRTTHAIEGKGDSKRNARELIERHYKGTEYFWLPDADEYLLVAELLRGTVTNEDRAAILEVLERMGTELRKIFEPGKVELGTLVKAFAGKEADRLNDFFTRRYEGGLKAVQSGTIKTKGHFIPQGLPLSSIDVVRKFLDWLKTKKKTASTFFADSWSKNKLLLLGEMHYDDVQRVFAADMLRANGGKDTGLALEVHISLQSEIDHYIEHGTLPQGAKSWWKNDERYKKLIDAAKATKVQV